MAKIRGIKPEFWTDESVIELSIPARLLFIGMWNHACDNGHLQDRSKQIKMRVLPTDDVNCAELLREIEHQGLIERVDGWITIPTLTHHQKPHKRWWSTCDKEGCEVPEGASHAPFNRGATVAQPKSNRVATTDCDVDCDGDGEGEGDSGLPLVAAAKISSTTETPAADAAPAKPKRATKRGTKRPDDWRPNPGHLAQAITLGIDPAEQLAAFSDYCEANGKTYVDWNAAFRTWLRNAKRFDRGGSAPRQKADADMFERMAQRAEAHESHIRGEIA